MAISPAMCRVIFHRDMDAFRASIEQLSIDETYLDLSGLCQAEDADDRKVLRARLRTQAGDISARLKHRRLGAHTVEVKVS